MSSTLIIRHLPKNLSESEKKSLLKHFGAVNVRCMPDFGPLKNIAFATFNREEEAKAALSRLHQLDVLGCRLVVEFAHEKSSSHLFPSLEDKVPLESNHDEIKSDENKNVGSESGQMLMFFKSIHSVLNGTDYGYPISPLLAYSYPPATPFIVNNIAQVLISVPKFYVQVLHLMNKMNLPAPFSQSVTQPVLPPMYFDQRLGAPTEENNFNEEMDIDESELESEEELELNRTYESQNNVPLMKKRKKHRLRKRPRLEDLIPPQNASKSKSSTKPVDTSDVFDVNESSTIYRKIEINLSREVDLEKDAEDESAGIQEGGFGRMEPVNESNKPSEEPECENKLNPLHSYISKDKLKRNRISREEMKDLSVFKKYEPGDPTTRLYLKNLSKQTTEKDILYIYGRYINWNSEDEVNIFDIRLMKEGRMKGQGFVTFPNEDVSKEALVQTNGYILHGKPIIVQFARSAKPKEVAK